MPNMPHANQEDYLLGRGANPRTGEITPGSESCGGSVEEASKCLQPGPALSTVRWQQRGDQWISVDQTRAASHQPRSVLPGSFPQSNSPQHLANAPATSFAHSKFQRLNYYPQAPPLHRLPEERLDFTSSSSSAQETLYDARQDGPHLLSRSDVQSQSPIKRKPVVHSDFPSFESEHMPGKNIVAHPLDRHHQCHQRSNVRHGTRSSSAPVRNARTDVNNAEEAMEFTQVMPVGHGRQQACPTVSTPNRSYGPISINKDLPSLPSGYKKDIRSSSLLSASRTKPSVRPLGPRDATTTDPSLRRAHRRHRVPRDLPISPSQMQYTKKSMLAVPHYDNPPRYGRIAVAGPDFRTVTAERASPPKTQAGQESGVHTRLGDNATLDKLQLSKSVAQLSGSPITFSDTQSSIDDEGDATRDIRDLSKLRPPHTENVVSHASGEQLNAAATVQMTRKVQESYAPVADLVTPAAYGNSIAPNSWAVKQSSKSDASKECYEMSVSKISGEKHYARFHVDAATIRSPLQLPQTVASTASKAFEGHERGSQSAISLTKRPCSCCTGGFVLGDPSADRIPPWISDSNVSVATDMGDGTTSIIIRSRPVVEVVDERALSPSAIAEDISSVRSSESADHSACCAECCKVGCHEGCLGHFTRTSRHQLQNLAPMEQAKTFTSPPPTEPRCSNQLQSMIPKDQNVLSTLCKKCAASVGNTYKSEKQMGPEVSGLVKKGRDDRTLLSIAGSAAATSRGLAENTARPKASDAHDTPDLYLKQVRGTKGSEQHDLFNLKGLGGPSSLTKVTTYHKSRGTELEKKRSEPLGALNPECSKSSDVATGEKMVVGRRDTTPLTGWNMVVKSRKRRSSLPADVIELSQQNRDHSVRYYWETTLIPFAAIQMWLKNNPWVRTACWASLAQIWTMGYHIKQTSGTLLQCMYTYSKSGDFPLEKNDGQSIGLARDLLTSVLCLVILAMLTVLVTRVVSAIFAPLRLFILIVQAVFGGVGRLSNVVMY